jgi:hypothetical protein
VIEGEKSLKTKDLQILAGDAERGLIGFMAISGPKRSQKNVGNPLVYCARQAGCRNKKLEGQDEEICSSPG